MPALPFQSRTASKECKGAWEEESGCKGTCLPCSVLGWQRRRS